MTITHSPQMNPVDDFSSYEVHIGEVDGDDDALVVSVEQYEHLLKAYEKLKSSLADDLDHLLAKPEAVTAQGVVRVPDVCDRNVVIGLFGNVKGNAYAGGWDDCLKTMLAATPAAPQQAGVADDLLRDDWISTADLDARLETLAEEYKWRNGGDYTPDGAERAMLTDFSHGIMADETFIAMLKAHHDPNARGNPSAAPQPPVVTNAISQLQYATRYFASGPEGYFYAGDHTFAERLIAIYDRDDWTITDLRNPLARQAQATLTAVFPYGSVDTKGNWYPNQEVNMSAADQHKHNIASGYSYKWLGRDWLEPKEGE